MMSRLRRWLRYRTDVAERTASTAVAEVVQLEHHAARIRNEQLARAVRRSAFILPACANERLLRSWFIRVCWRGGDAMRRERLHRTIDGEVLHTETKSADAWTFIRGCLSKRDESRTVANAQQHRGALPGLHRHPEESLIKVERPLDVGHGQRDLTETVDAELRRRRGLREQPRRHGQCGERGEEMAAVDECEHGGILYGRQLPTPECQRPKNRQLVLTARFVQTRCDGHRRMCAPRSLHSGRWRH